MRTILKNGEHEIIIEKSRFICTMKKIENEEEAIVFIRELKKKYWDASHNCSAFIINQSQQRSNDDGEPSGTAGLPMLEVLRKNNLFNVVAVVTRYFGGIKLGAGGLVRAYTKSVSETLLKIGLAEKILLNEYYFEEDLENSGRTLNLLYQQKFFSISNIIYAENVKIYINMKPETLSLAQIWLNENLNRTVVLSLEKSTYIEEACIV